VKEYWVSCSVIIYGHRSVLVEAKNKKQAQEIGEAKIFSNDPDVEVNDDDVQLDNVEVEEA